MSEYDFKGALEGIDAYKGEGWWCPNCGDTDCSYEGNCTYCGFHIETNETLDNNLKTIQFALKLADRLQSGEISEKMSTEGVKIMSTQFPDEYEPLKAILVGQPKDVFKAMMAQLMKEVSKDDTQ